MSHDFAFNRLQQIVAELIRGRQHGIGRSPSRRSPNVESLEGRALMANITASGVINSTAAGADFNYSINLTNSSSSSAAIGTFWYAWVPGQDRLATSPIAVTAPAGWSDQITHDGAGDGYAILFTANSAASEIQPGSSLNFSFESADSPAALNGNSTFFPGMPVSAAFVYPAGPFSDAGHEFVVTPAQISQNPPPSNPPTSNPPPPPLVTIASVRDIPNKKHLVTQIDIEFSGAVNAADAQSGTHYRLVMPGKKGSYSAKNARVINLKSAVYDAALNEVILTPRAPFALTKPVQLTVDGEAPTGIHDSAGQLIDGAHTGQPGSNAVVVLARNQVTF